jgi:Tfp pilus assembly protein PilF
VLVHLFPVEPLDGGRLASRLFSGGLGRARTRIAGTAPVTSHTPRVQTVMKRGMTGMTRLQTGLACLITRTTHLQTGTAGTTKRRCVSSPTCPEVHGNLAAALAERGRIDEAIAHYEEALRLKPDDAKARLNLALLQAQAHRRPRPR